MSTDIILVAGARPNFMKLAPLSRALRRQRISARILHTGQHYDPRLSEVFFRQLEIPTPSWQLDAGSGSHARQTGKVMAGVEDILLETRPAWIVTVGDVNSTLGAALAAAKLRGSVRTRIAHVEAGLRSGDWTMPEEVNRVLTDRLSDALFTPSRDASANLVSEGIPTNRIVFVGNTMVDCLRNSLPFARECRLAARLGLTPRRYGVLTIHRPENVDDPGRLRSLIEEILMATTEVPLVWPVHPRSSKVLRNMDPAIALRTIRQIEPLGYFEMISLLADSKYVLTDSGGLQEESTVLGVPCATLRPNTERPITITEGTNTLVPWPPTADGVASALGESRKKARMARVPEGWDGLAAERIADHLRANLKEGAG